MAPEYTYGSPKQSLPAAPWVQKAHDETTRPLTLSMPVTYGARHGGEGMEVKRSQQNKRHLVMDRSRISGPLIMKAAVCILIAPLIFFWCSAFLSFYPHYQMPRRTWMIVSLALIPVLFSAWGSVKTLQMGLDARWAIATTILFAGAFLSGTLLGDINYLTNLHPFYFIRSLKSYSNIKPTEVSGTQLMDAGRVVFAEGTKLLIDMGMSFTMDSTFCVAPIGVDGGGQGGSGPTLATYDLWAVGKDCCKTSNPTFACGEYANIKAKSGLRQTSEGERLYYTLAVQQAEAAYGITAAHPVFFHWVEDADSTMQSYFNNGFRAWVFATFAHMTMNIFIVALLINILKYNNRALFKDEHLPGQFMLAHSGPGGEH